MRYLIASLLLLQLCTCGRALEEHTETDDLGYRTDYTADPETGQREGVARRFDPDGNLVAEENYTGGKLDGLRTAYYPDGKPEIVENYRAGQFEGEYITYDSLGNMRLRGQYVGGSMGNIWTRYWPDGGVREKVAFADNRENGPFREWYENGQPSAAGTYLEGKEQGTLFVFDEQNGELTAVRDCQTGVCTTQWRREDGGPAPADPPDMTRPPGVNATN
ncbi:toxin-antitoxin system YwqK family antitoxin [Neolewinella sp.]|uniref:toxin-antitoxin system YwqK family antitoxin n=1 Tax=Neolewinella sp. TaxID=2993543 RepID=UPI003B51E721